MNKSLYTIDRELEEILYTLEENGGEITPEIEEKLAISQEELFTKLDSYTKAIALITSKAEACKKEKARIDGLQKSRERTVERLKSYVLNAVLKYGDINKSGNKVRELETAKLMTRNNKVCEIDNVLVSRVIDILKDRLRELWNNYMLDVNFDNIDTQGMLATINAELNAMSTDVDNNINITEQDLEATKVKFITEVNLKDLFSKINYDILNTYFNHEETNGYMELSSGVSDYKRYIDGMGTELNFAKICFNPSLNIK